MAGCARVWWQRQHAAAAAGAARAARPCAPALTLPERARGASGSVQPLIAAIAAQEQQQNQQSGSSAADAPLPAFPQRPGQALCDFYAKTGHCKFGELCKFDHPLEYAVRLNALGLPAAPRRACVRAL